MSIALNIHSILSEIPASVTLVAVSKTYGADKIEEAYEFGQRVFGENKVQELCDKQLVLPQDIQWHLIGHLQTNKVKYIAPFVSLIHSVDSLKLLQEINKRAAQQNRSIHCLLQMHIASEETKFGLSEQEAIELLESDTFSAMKNVTIAGLMGMATNTSNEAVIRAEFAGLKHFFNTLKASYFSTSDSFSTLSMGMSSDYKIAIEEGSTMIRVGSSIFGHRNYL